jgi:hypothetical protein
MRFLLVVVTQYRFRQILNMLLDVAESFFVSRANLSG